MGSEATHYGYFKILPVLYFFQKNSKVTDWGVKRPIMATSIFFQFYTFLKNVCDSVIFYWSVGRFSREHHNRDILIEFMCVDTNALKMHILAKKCFAVGYYKYRMYVVMAYHHQLVN